MSKLLLFSVFSILTLNVMAQETKKPTLEELIPGGESYRYAENLYGLQWWGDECIKPGVDTLYSPVGSKANTGRNALDRMVKMGEKRSMTNVLRPIKKESRLACAGR